MKFAVETFYTAKMTVFAQCCGYSLALSHARSGDAAMICGCLGRCDEFDNVIADFSIAYADQNQMDHAVLKRAILGGEVEAVFERDEVKMVRGDLKKMKIPHKYS